MKKRHMIFGTFDAEAAITAKFMVSDRVVQRMTESDDLRRVDSGITVM